MEAFVYCWTDFGTNKLYVGVHKGTPDDGYVCSSKLMLEEHTKRPNDFSRQIIASGSFKEMYVLETAILKAACADKDPGYYNLHLNTGKFNTYGVVMPEETKRKLSEKARGRPAPNKGVPHTAETKCKMRNRWTPERRKKLSQLGKMNKGKVLTDKHRERIGLGQVGRRDSLETIMKRAASNTGKKRSPETREWIRQAALLRTKKVKV